MIRIKVMPMLGELKYERFDSLRGCHAIHERQIVKVVKNGQPIGPALEGTDAG